MTYQLRSPDDVRRLFSAFGDELEHESLSLMDVDRTALEITEPQDLTSLMLSAVVAMAAGWTAIQGFQRNQNSMQWGLTWAVLGFLFPVPAVAYSAFQSAR